MGYLLVKSLTFYIYDSFIVRPSQVYVSYFKLFVTSHCRAGTIIMETEFKYMCHINTGIHYLIFQNTSIFLCFTPRNHRKLSRSNDL